MFCKCIISITMRALYVYRKLTVDENKQLEEYLIVCIKNIVGEI